MTSGYAMRLLGQTLLPFQLCTATTVVSELACPYPLRLSNPAEGKTKSSRFPCTLLNQANAEGYLRRLILLRFHHPLQTSISKTGPLCSAGVHRVPNLPLAQCGPENRPYRVNDAKRKFSSSRTFNAAFASLVRFRTGQLRGYLQRPVRTHPPPLVLHLQRDMRRIAALWARPNPLGRDVQTKWLDS